MKLLNLTAGLALTLLPITSVAVAAQEAGGAPVTDPQQFADTASSSNTFEIESSQLALGRSQDEDVLAFAEQMIADHTAAAEQMTAAAEQDGITPATGMMDRHQEMLDSLNAAEDGQFDGAYIDAQIAAHEEAVALFDGYATNGEEGALKTFASETLPILEQHREHIRSIGSSPIQ